MTKNFGIIDYGCGNIHSLKCALQKIGGNVCILSDNKIMNIDALFIPGVGSFNNAMEKMTKKKLDVLIKEYNKENKLIIGICLGMQILLDKGFENYPCEGLSLIKGQTYKLAYNQNQKKINIGWKKTIFNDTKNLNQFNNEKFYYVHSYAVHVEKNNIYSTTFFNDKNFISGIRKDNLIAFQFDPEKSGNIGLDLLDTVTTNFI